MVMAFDLSFVLNAEATAGAVSSALTKTPILSPAIAPKKRMAAHEDINGGRSKQRPYEGRAGLFNPVE
jgi:hypothetical protein